jgi:hypothetical protein
MSRLLACRWDSRPEKLPNTEISFFIKYNMFENYQILKKVIAYSVPFGHHALVFELGEFSPIVDGSQQLPEEKQGKADQHNGSDDAQYNSCKFKK